MAKEWARDFYASRRWTMQRAAYIRYKHGICERCGMPGKIVHHRKALTPRTIADDAATMDFANLELLCQECHNREHSEKWDAMPGLYFDEDGDLRPVVPPGRGTR